MGTRPTTVAWSLISWSDSSIATHQSNRRLSWLAPTSVMVVVRPVPVRISSAGARASRPPDRFREASAWPACRCLSRALEQGLEPACLSTLDVGDRGTEISQVLTEHHRGPGLSHASFLRGDDGDQLGAPGRICTISASSFLLRLTTLKCDCAGRSSFPNAPSGIGVTQHVIETAGLSLGMRLHRFLGADAARRRLVEARSRRDRMRLRHSPARSMRPAMPRRVSSSIPFILASAKAAEISAATCFHGTQAEWAASISL